MARLILFTCYCRIESLPDGLGEFDVRDVLLRVLFGVIQISEFLISTVNEPRPPSVINDRFFWESQVQ